MNSNLKTIKFIVIGITIVSSIIVLILFSGYTSSNIIDEINLGAFGFAEEVNSIIFEYESKDAVIVFYSGEKLTYETILDKRTIFGTAKYRNRETSSSSFYHAGYEWITVNKNLKYVVVDNKSELEKYDCEGYEPIISEFDYFNSDNVYQHRWIMILDKTAVHSVV